MQAKIKNLFIKNKILTTMGFLFLFIGFLLGIIAVFNPTKILGINGMVKPIKFCLSTFIYAISMAYLLHFVNNKKSVKWYSILATMVMLYENGVIIIQAFRGKLSHFNKEQLADGIAYAIMGVMIVWLTTATLVITIRFILQKTTHQNKAFMLAIKIGMVMFVIFSFLGGYMSAINSHNIGGQIGKEGLPLINWSTLFGDVRVAHFFGIHALQIIPLVGYFVSTKYQNEKKAKTIIWLTAIIYFSFICFTFFQALHGKPFIGV